MAPAALVHASAPAALTRVPIQHAPAALIAACVNASASDAPPAVAEWLLPRLMKRRTLPEPLDLLIDDHGPAGWVGLFRVPQSDLYGSVVTVEVTTYLSPRLRGQGLFDVAMCWQAHMVDDLMLTHGTQLKVVASIADWNARSIAAFTRYANQHGWPQDWTVVGEPTKDRISHILRWPVPVPHTCHA